MKQVAFCTALIVALLATGIAPGTVRAQDQDERVLVLLEPVRVTLNAQTPAEDWTFEGRAGQVISILAVTVSGDLDPVLQVIGPDDALVAENDDIDALVTDAGLETLTLPVDGTYTIRAARYQGADGVTAGQVDLIVSPGFARVTRLDTFDSADSAWMPEAGDENITLAQGRLRVRVIPAGTIRHVIPSDAEPVKDLYMQAAVRRYGSPSYAEAGLVFRAEVVGSAVRGYRFRVNTEGKWMVELADESGTFVLQSWTSNRALNPVELTLAVLARENTLAFYGNGVLLGTLTDDRLVAPGAFGVLVGTREGQPDPATMQFDDVLITTRLGTTYRGLPLTLAAWDATNPAAIKDELVALGQIAPMPERALYVADTSLTSDRVSAEFTLLGTDQARYENFLLGGTINLAAVGPSTACGLVYRWQDERHLDMAAIDATGGFSVVQARDGDLTLNVYDHSAMIASRPNKLLVIAQGDRVALYINGALVAQETVSRARGRIGVSLLNYEAAISSCFFYEVWVWPLDE